MNGTSRLFAALLTGLTACGGSMVTTDSSADPLPTLSDVTPDQWAALAQRQVFFGHQSVGGNIMQGIVEVTRDHPEIKLNVVESRIAPDTGTAFRHAAIGRNEYPLEKFDEFATIASTGFGPDGGIAMVKLCYVDMHDDTDVNHLLAEYQRRVADVRARSPALTIVHFTVPLTTIENWKGRARALLERRATERDRNVVRQRYNQLLRQTYAGKEPLFDLAHLESTFPDGGQLAFRAGDQLIPMLVPAYTDDGSHLNALARRRVAEQLLIMLARLDGDMEARPVAASAR